MAYLPPEFINTIKKDLPSHLSVDDFIYFCAKPLRRSIRVNTLKISCKDFIKHMHSKGWQFESIPWCNNGFWITGQQDENLGNCIEHLQGLFYIQEASSMLPPTALFDDNQIERSQMNILDMAAAPGSKTTQIATLMENNGLLIANEYSSSRVKVLHANLCRTGITNCAITHFNGNVFGEYLFEQFDLILIDAPCGGEGTIRKDPDALKNWQLTDIENIANVQKSLIESAFLALKPNGKLIYSTCTLNTIENQQVCHYLKQKYVDAVQFNSLKHLFDNAHLATTEEGFLHVWPQIYDSEGFFVASITKRGSVTNPNSIPKLQKNFPFQEATNKQKQEISTYLLTTFTISLPDEKIIMVRDNEYWLFPKNFQSFIGKMRFQRIGIKIAEHTKHGFKISHEAIMSLPIKSTSMMELTHDEAKSYLMGRDIMIDNSQGKGEVIVSYLNRPLGLGKKLPNKLKNNLPRELVRDNACVL